MRSKESLQYLLKKLRDSSQKKNDIEGFLNSTDQEVIERIKKEHLVEDALQLLNNLDVDADWELVKAQLHEGQFRKAKIKEFLKYAAVFLGLVTLGITLFYFNNGQSDALQTQIDEDFISLDTGNGIKILDGSGNHPIKLPSGNIVVQSGDTLIYNIDNNGGSSEYNELHVPNGLLFSLVLSDGTKINLNSGSRIKFPVAFPKNGNREVFVYGEAYFDVTKDKHRPFIVNSGDIRVSVLGTEFNFSSYKNQNEVTTVLVEGSVSLKPNSNLYDSTILVPGDKGAWSRSMGQMEVEQVNTSLYTGWKNGEVVFRNASFTELLETLERVYDVHIENNNNSITDQTFNARFNRNVERIEDVLDGLQVLAPFEYIIQKEKNTRDKEITIR